MMTDLFNNLNPVAQQIWVKERAAICTALSVAVLPITLIANQSAISQGIILSAECYSWVDKRLATTHHRADFLLSLTRRATLRMSECGFVIIEDSHGCYHSHCAFCLTRICEYKERILCCQSCETKYNADLGRLLFLLFAVDAIIHSNYALRDALTNVKSRLIEN